MKKKPGSVLLMGVLMLSLAACGKQKPDLKEVEAAITKGDVTIEDALEKCRSLRNCIMNFRRKM